MTVALPWYILNVTIPRYPARGTPSFHSAKTPNRFASTLNSRSELYTTLYTFESAASFDAR